MCLHANSSRGQGSGVGETASLPGPEGFAQRRGHVDADPGRVARDEHQHGDGGEVGQHGEPLARDLDALALQVELQHGHAAKEVGPQQHARRPPGGKGGERQRNPALARDKVRNRACIRVAPREPTLCDTPTSTAVAVNFRF